MALDLWYLALATIFALSLRSALVLRRSAGSEATIAGWLATAAYAIAAATHAATGAAAANVAGYVLLVALTVAFVLAGRRDEPQAEPWWWPAGPGTTGAERRAAKTAAKR